MYASFLDCSWCVKSKVSSSVAEPNKEKPRLLRKVMCFFGIFFLFGKDLGTCVFTLAVKDHFWGCSSGKTIFGKERPFVDLSGTWLWLNISDLHVVSGKTIEYPTL